MKILVLNSGSSTLKFDLMDVGAQESGQTPGRLAHGVVDRIGRESNLEFHLQGGGTERRDAPVKDHREAVAQVFAWLGRYPDLLAAGIDAVGHRVVHGGDGF